MHTHTNTPTNTNKQANVRAHCVRVAPTTHAQQHTIQPVQTILSRVTLTHTMLLSLSRLLIRISLNCIHFGLLSTYIDTDTRKTILYPHTTRHRHTHGPFYSWIYLMLIRSIGTVGELGGDSYK